MIEVSIRHTFTGLPRERDAAATADPVSDRWADIDVAFESPSRALALFGDSGAGKTTVLNAIAGLLHPASGRIVLDGQVLFDSALSIALPPARRQVGYVFQDGRLFPHMTVRANLLYGTRSRRAPADDFDALVSLLDLGRLLGRRPATLSGGERQRAAIARALLSAPRILLLDEPLTGLHHDARAQVLEHLCLLKQAMPVALIVVSHQPEEVQALADDVLIMQAGRIVHRLANTDFPSWLQRQRGPLDGDRG